MTPQTNIPATVLSFVAKKYGVRLVDLLAVGRERWRVEPRQVAHYLADKLMPNRQMELARIFEQDRTTIYHSIKAVINRMQTDRKFQAKVESLETECFRMFE